MRPIIVIPARLASTRLPRKPLADIGGMPMIARVAQQALASGVGPVVVAADSEEILEAVSTLKEVQGVLTPPDLPSGSDRVAAALEAIDPQGRYETVVNLQGDQPMIVPGTLERALLPLRDPAIALGTLVTLIHSEKERDADSIVKAACAFRDGEEVARALYFSRQPIPWGEGPLWHHVGVYAWRREALSRFVKLPPTMLEQRERLEQLRALEAGMAIGCAQIDAMPPGVDTAADLAYVRRLFACP